MNKTKLQQLHDRLDETCRTTPGLPVTKRDLRDLLAALRDTPAERTVIVDGDRVPACGCPGPEDALVGYGSRCAKCGRPFYCSPAPASPGHADTDRLKAEGTYRGAVPGKLAERMTCGRCQLRWIHRDPDDCCPGCGADLSESAPAPASSGPAKGDVDAAEWTTERLDALRSHAMKGGTAYTHTEWDVIVLDLLDEIARLRSEHGAQSKGREVWVVMGSGGPYGAYYSPVDAANAGTELVSPWRVVRAVLDPEPKEPSDE